MRHTRRRRGESLRCLINDLVIRGSRDHIVKTLERYAHDYFMQEEFGMGHKFMQCAEHWRKQDGQQA